jgi:ferredoxin
MHYTGFPVREPDAPAGTGIKSRRSAMKLLVDLAVCEGHGECVIAAPELFDLDESGAKVIVLNDDPDEALRAKVVQAVKLCPVAALRLED